MPSAPSERTKQRRRILQATLGAPAVFTLPSGAAFAATSLSCREKSVSLAQNSPPPGISREEDTWMRYRLQRYTIQTNGGSVNGFTLGSSWFQVNDQGEAVAVTPTEGTTPQPVADGYYFALVDYSKYSPTAGVGYVYPTASPVSSPIAGASCWNSLLATALTSNVVN